MEDTKEFSEEDIKEFRSRSQDNFFMSDSEIVAALARERDGYKEPEPESEEVKKLRSDFKKVTEELEAVFKTIGDKVESATLLATFVALTKTLIYLNVKKALLADNPKAVEGLTREIVATTTSLESIIQIITAGELLYNNTWAKDRNEVAAIAKRLSDRLEFTEFSKKK